MHPCTWCGDGHHVQRLGTGCRDPHTCNSSSSQPRTRVEEPPPIRTRHVALASASAGCGARVALPAKILAGRPGEADVLERGRGRGASWHHHGVLQLMGMEVVAACIVGTWKKRKVPSCAATDGTRTPTRWKMRDPSSPAMHQRCRLREPQTLCER